MFVQAVERRNEVAFKKELESNLFPFVAKEKTQASFFDVIQRVCQLSLFQQKRFGGDRARRYEFFDEHSNLSLMPEYVFNCVFLSEY